MTGDGNTYDNNGNITAIRDGDENLLNKYYYDDIGQLIREDNEALTKTYVYTYDNAGNRTSKKTYAYTTSATLGTAQSTENYSYPSNSSYTNWGDQLISLNGNAITYDDVGNPLEYYLNYIDEYRLFGLEWEGRNLVFLSEISAGERDIYYEYNDEGIRTSKNDGGTEYKYTLNGTQIVSQEWEDKLIVFFYDESGAPIGYGYRTTSMAADTFYYYIYEKNLQGDIVAIYNTSGTKLVSYTYDAWGNVSVSNINVSGTNVGARYNPFRYRGYYYDEEVGLYYLNSRYYDPRTGRFLNADVIDVVLATPDALTDKNLYAYCDNNPVMRVDNGGEFWHILVGAAVGVVTQYISDVVTNLINGESFAEALKSKSTWADYAAAALSGALAATGIGIGASIIANAAIGGATYLANSIIRGKEANIVDFGLSMTVGAISGIVGGSGADGATLRGITKTSKTILKTAISPKKIAMYSAKIATCGKKAIISGVRTVAAGFVGNGLNAIRRGVTLSEV